LFKIYADLTKFGIVVFVLISGVAGYATGYTVESEFSVQHFAMFFFGLYFLSSGSLALNQWQEIEIDKKMPRTSKRPLATGKLMPRAALILSLLFIWSGLQALYNASAIAFWVGVASVVLYNGLYTMWWKKSWAFAAVPGAIPGALPITIGYAAVNPDIFNSESVYLFLIMFLWQMPHFWTLAIKYKEDYRAGGIPVLPTVAGTDITLKHIGLYTFVYVGVALASPWFVNSSIVYLALVVPFAGFVLKEYMTYLRSGGQRWFSFFMWTNISMLIFVIVPVIDKWSFLITERS
jgi:heme o synthase